MKGKKLRLSRMAVAMFCVVLAVVSVDGLRRKVVYIDPSTVVEKRGNFPDERGETPPTIVKYDPEDTTIASDDNVSNPGVDQKPAAADEVFKGVLVPASRENPIVPENSNASVNLVEYGNDYYSVIGEDVHLNKDAADSLNKMMEDYFKATGYTDFVVYGTTSTYTGEDSPCQIDFPDSAGGNTIDVALIGYDSMLTYDGYDLEGWLIENCMNYGYIVRYPSGKEAVTKEQYCPWHLRYVGQPHAFVMTANNMCLEEYVEYIRRFNIDKPFECSVDNDVYHIYSVPSNGDVTYINVPQKKIYSISGDGSTGFIVCVKK